MRKSAASVMAFVCLTCYVAALDDSTASIGDRVKKWRDDASMAYTKACSDKSTANDARKAMTSLSRLLGQYSALSAEYVQALQKSDVLDSDTRKTKIDEATNLGKSIETADDYCQLALAGAKPADTAKPASAIPSQANALVTPAPAKGETDPSKPEFWTDNYNFRVIAGVESAGISSLPASGTSGFVSAWTRTDTAKLAGMWGRIRLLGVPDKSADGIVTTFTDPSGKLNSVDWKKVGSAVDFTFGPEFKLYPWGKPGQYTVSFIGFLGATSPLSSQDVVLRYKVPAKNTAECALLASRFGAANGYPDIVKANTDPASTNCLANGIGFLAFSNEDRTSFLRKYGFGFRTIYRIQGSAEDIKNGQRFQSGVVDFTVGQDEAIRRGKLSGWLFRVDGEHPLSFGGNHYLYLFGSAAIRITRNQTQQNLILDVADASAAPIPSPAVALLPLKQPDRDFFRVGLGLDVFQLFQKLSGSAKQDNSASAGGGSGTGTAAGAATQPK